ncbi:hypothetical protein [Propionivibrio sp.]|uniref:hypothetical protein n=1 Tax=Propionivibrio sp. TaxID=2212460 RepID=UPI003BF44A6D
MSGINRLDKGQTVDFLCETLRPLRLCGKELRFLGLKANAQNVNAVSVGEGNTAKNAVGAIKGGTKIQGNTNITAKAKNVNAVAVGENNTATNNVGTIGGQ